LTFSWDSRYEYVEIAVDLGKTFKLANRPKPRSKLKLSAGS